MIFDSDALTGSSEKKGVIRQLSELLSISGGPGLPIWVTPMHLHRDKQTRNLVVRTVGLRLRRVIYGELMAT